MASSTRRRVGSRTGAVPLTTLETVALATRATAATSAMLAKRCWRCLGTGFTPKSYCV